MRRGWLPAALLLTSACVAEPPAPPRDEAQELLILITRLIESRTPEERRSIEEAERARFEDDPSYDNLLRLAMVRAFGGALPAELIETRNDLQALANGRHELSANQRRLALMVLIMVDQRLQMGNQIVDLQRQIDSLTAIEASLNRSRERPTSEQQP